MGFWDSLKNTVVEANENAHAERLHNDLGITLRMVDQLPAHLRSESLMTFLEFREKVIKDIQNWSYEGALKVAKDFFGKARELQHLNKKDSLAFAMAGLWLEGALRKNPKAELVHDHMEDLAQTLINSLNKTVEKIEEEDPWADFAEEPQSQNFMKLMNAMADSNPDAIDLDVFPGCSGAFGFSVDNPIPCHTIVGSRIYLESLRYFGHPINYERVGSFESQVTDKPVDGYEISVKDAPIYSGRKWVIYISPYQKRNSTLAPSNFTLFEDEY